MTLTQLNFKDTRIKNETLNRLLSLVKVCDDCEKRFRKNDSRHVEEILDDNLYPTGKDEILCFNCWY